MEQDAWYFEVDEKIASIFSIPIAFKFKIRRHRYRSPPPTHTHTPFAIHTASKKFKNLEFPKIDKFWTKSKSWNDLIRALFPKHMKIYLLHFAECRQKQKLNFIFELDVFSWKNTFIRVDWKDASPVKRYLVIPGKEKVFL